MGTEAVCPDEIMCLDRKEEVWIGPATPEEKGEHHHHRDDLSPPLTGTQTPKETLFDSFAPASDKFCLAPYRRKYRDESRNLVVRRLDFQDSDSDSDLDFTSTTAKDVSESDEEEEKRLFEIVYATIMDAIFAEQEVEQASTPKSAPLLTGVGVAETCPEAPIKSARKQRCSIIDKEICRKLEF